MKRKIDIVRQHDKMDCGVCSLLSIIKFHGGINTLDNLRRVTGSSITGTSILGLKEGAIKVGFNAEGFEANINALKSSDSPLILHLIVENNLPHYVVFFGTKQEKKNCQYIIGDPAKGIVYMPSEELDSLWKSKVCLVLEPNENFVKAKDNNMLCSSDKCNI